MKTESNKSPQSVLSADKLQTFFITHLNRVYCAKSHLQERLPELIGHVHFSDLAHAISETLTDVENQLVRMEQIFSILDTQPQLEDCLGMTCLIENAFSAIHQDPDDPEMRDLSILFYLQNIESIEMASFNMLNAAAPGVAQKEIRLLLQQNFDEASEDLALLRLIMDYYFKK
jgi:ferritin-like metal-binding protein YciE